MRPKHSLLLSVFRGERANAGIAAVEFALIVPIFLILFMGCVDLGQMLFDYYQLDEAVGAGSEYAALNAANVTSSSGAALATSLATTVANANGSAWANDTIVVNDGPSVTVTNGSSSSSGTATNANNYYCLTGTGPSWSWGTGSSSQGSCASGGTSGKYVTITASYAYVPWLKIYSFIGDKTLTQNAAIRVQ